LPKMQPTLVSEKYFKPPPAFQTFAGQEQTG